MELYETSTSAEEQMRRDADLTHTPLGGTLELLPLCNMDCKMCYVHQTREEMDAQGRMLTCDEWLHIAEEACDKGLLFLLLTGGEPLLYPEFRRLYTGISRMGVFLDVNTNGTLIDEEWADFFYENGTKKLNITLYGKDDATYGRLCGNPHGFTQVMRAARLLKERKVPFRFNCTLTADNIDQLPDFYEIARSFEVVLSPAAYMFPGVRRGKNASEQYRLSPEQAARAEMYEYHPRKTDGAETGTEEAFEKELARESKEAARETLSRLEPPARLKGRVGFPCHAGHSGFLINWKGELSPCGMFLEPKISALEHPFEKCWDYIIDATEKLPQCQQCINCDMQNICTVCPACCYTETGSTDGCPDYVCRMTEYKVRELRMIAE